MKPEDMEAKMRRLEVFHDLRVPDGCWPIICVDGRCFHTITDDMEKPFDERFHIKMLHVARCMATDLAAVYAYVQSDEISVLLHRDTDMFDRSWEKLVSVSAGIASSEFSSGAVRRGTFDGRVIVAASLEQIIDYFRWRQADAFRSCLNGWAFWSAVKSGKTRRQAAKILSGMNASAKNEYLFSEHGININDKPAWQRRGIGMYWKLVDWKGHNPKTDEDVIVKRRVLYTELDLLAGDEYAQFLEGLLR